MLSSAPDRQPRPPRRPEQSLRQEYHEFLLQRIEEYKSGLGRQQILAIGDEAVRELEASSDSQYLLTEVLLLEHVDRIISRRLRLPSFPRWKRTHRALREAQRQPTHWGLDPDGLLVDYALRLEPGDGVAVLGSRWLPAALFIAAHDFDVMLLDQDLGAVEAAEQRAVTERLASRFDALVVQFGGWFPELLPTLAIVDPAALAATPPRQRAAALAALQTRTRPGGVHLILPAVETKQVIPIAPESLQRQYAGWQIVRRPKRQRGGGFAAVKPMRQSDTASSVSD
ncbi:MAG: hypothetical protein ACREF4_14895 [Gammaproteobacteria bacterium]